MNNIMYPADEIAKSFAGLERTPAPFGHPMVNGQYVSASDPEGYNISGIGAWNENVRRENGRVFMDKVIDIERANQSENGRRVIEAANKGEPIHTSTGLLCELDKPAEGATDHTHVARNMIFDHDAILLDVSGAATPKQGVGMFVNTSGETMDVINCSIADQDFDWAVESVFRAVDKKLREPLFERVKAAILELVSGAKQETATNEDDGTMSKEELDKLSGQVAALNDSVAKIGDTVAAAVVNALKPLTDAHNAAAATAKAAADAEHAELVAKVVANKTLDEATAKDTPTATLKALANSVKSPAAPILGGGFQTNSNERRFAVPE